MNEIFMRRCFELAVLGEGFVSPNPVVGAVLVHEERIIGEGWHQRYGQAHAEVNCIHSVKPADRSLISASTLYCSLEPCHHYGKTPPCVNLVLEHKIPKVVISNHDPNPLVAGKSVVKMRSAGVEVITDVLADEGRWLNRVFFHFIQTRKPWTILKWAQSADGFISRVGERTAISGPVTQRLVHRWRSQTDAILVGTQTALVDNPRLDNRFWPHGKMPLRIFFDRQAKLPDDAHLLDDSQPTWGYTPARQGVFHQTEFKICSGGEPIIQRVLSDLQQAGKSSLLVEGGATTLQTFLEAEAWQEIRIIENPALYLKKGLSAPQLPKHAVLRDSFDVGTDRLKIYMLPT